MHTGAWIAWVTLVTVVALATTNPLYLAILLLCVILVAMLAPRTTAGAASFRVMAIFGTSLLAVSVLVATINGSYGEHILFTIPGPEIPDWLGGLRLGGPVSGEGLAAAAIRGMAILCIFLAFGVFGSAVSPYRVLRSTPGALFHASLVLTVGLTLLPSSVEDLRRIREMRALRGARGGWRDIPALVVPSVINGLERSMQLAEAMEARGYAASATPRRSGRIAAAASAPLFVTAAWMWFYSEGWKPAGAAGALLGIAAIGWWAWTARQAHRVTTLERELLPTSQRLAIAASMLAILLVPISRSTADSTLGYNPFAGLPVPGFTVGDALLVMTSIWPAVLLLVSPAPAVSPGHVPAKAREAAL